MAVAVHRAAGCLLSAGKEQPQQCPDEDKREQRVPGWKRERVLRAAHHIDRERSVTVHELLEADNQAAGSDDGDARERGVAPPPAQAERRAGQGATALTVTSLPNQLAPSASAVSTPLW